MRRQKEVNTSVLGSRARWFESVPERTNAKDPAPLKVKEVWVKERRYEPSFERSNYYGVHPDFKRSMSLQRRQKTFSRDIAFSGHYQG
jgi:hypothetical protein